MSFLFACMADTIAGSHGYLPCLQQEAQPQKERVQEGMIMTKSRDYKFLNKSCPVCGKPVDMYSYTIVDGKKVHLECAKDEK